jgi:SDR family mycofactocin-dependent oxidoreductase
MGRVDGKVAFITGAARGQGRSHAVRLAQEGADIIAVDICGPIPHLQYPHATPEDLAQTVKEVEALDRRIVAAEADVRDRAALGRILDDGVERLGRLDVVVANAGICVFGPWDEMTPEIWQTTIDINLTGVWNTVQLAAPHLIAGGRGGSIVLTSSTAGLKGQPFLTPYVAAKHGVVGLMRAFAHELAEHEIRVNSAAGGAPAARRHVHQRAAGRHHPARRHQQRRAVPRLRRGPLRHRADHDRGRGQHPVLKRPPEPAARDAGRLGRRVVQLALRSAAPASSAGAARTAGSRSSNAISMWSSLTSSSKMGVGMTPCSDIVPPLLPTARTLPHAVHDTRLLRLSDN